MTSSDDISYEEGGKVKVVRVEVRLTSKQAERLEQIYRMFNVPKSAMVEVALEEYFSKKQKVGLKTFGHHGKNGK